MYKRFIALLLCAVLLLPILPKTAAAYPNDYAGTMAGDGTGIYAHGVDLSEWQGHEVDFHKIKEQGYSFVILRAGFASTIDDCFEGNYARAKEAGLDVGVYLYSYADNTDEARQEAEAMLGWLEGKQLEYPVYYDLEDPKCHGSMSVELLTEIAFTFLDLLAAEGWLVGFYSCKSWLENKFDTAAIGQTYECWMAQFVPSGTYDIYDRYDEIYGMWQYSCTGKVAGVPGGVDMNVCFKDYPGICKQYGFNGYTVSDESLVLRAGDVPMLLMQGQSLPVSGKITSNDGNLLNVTAGIYAFDGALCSGRSVGPRSTVYDLADLAYGVRAQDLEAGTYLYRVSASNSYESRILLNQLLVISETGISLANGVLPEHLKTGEQFSLSGTMLCVSEIRELSLSVQDHSGETVLQSAVQPGKTVCELSALPADFSGLSTGEYRLRIEVQTADDEYCPVDHSFSVWAANDPLYVEQLRLQSEYFPGELRGLNGTVTSAASTIRQLELEVLDSSGETVKRVIAHPRKNQVSLSNYDSLLALEELPIGVYSLRISGLNDGGPRVLYQQRFLIREDGLGLCDPVVPVSIYQKDSFRIGGAVFSDETALRYVGLCVTDAKGRAVLSAGAIPNDSVYDLDGFNDSLCFSALDCGEYRLRITAENEDCGAVLYDGGFCVVDHRDVISWEEPCVDPRGSAYSASYGYHLNGVLRSASSNIFKATVEILLPTGEVFSAVELRGEGTTLSLEKCNEKIRFSALPLGDYILCIRANNASGSFELLRSAFSITECGHGSIRSGAFGKLTGTAVSRFQRDHGMEATEMADPDTFAAITAAWEKKTGKTADQE